MTWRAFAYAVAVEKKHNTLTCSGMATRNAASMSVVFPSTVMATVPMAWPVDSDSVAFSHSCGNVSMHHKTVAIIPVGGGEE